MFSRISHYREKHKKPIKYYMNKKSGKTSLFLIDDESDLTTTYSEILSDRYDVKTFNSAESALDALDT